MSEELRERLTEYKNKVIRGKEKLLLEVRFRNNLTIDIREHTEKIRIDILNEKDLNGKAMYSNQEKRNARFNEIVKGDLKHAALTKKLEEAEDEAKTLELEIEDNRYMFRIEEIIAKL